MADGAADYSALKAEYDAFKQKTEAWKVKMKQITTKDRTEISRLKDENETLAAGLRTANAVRKEKQELLDTLTRRVEELEHIESAGKATAERCGDLQQRLAEIDAKLQDATARCGKKETEVTALRARITELETANDTLTRDMEGAAYLADGSLAVHKKTSHASTAWLLCATPALPPRWLQEDVLVATLGRDAYAAIPTVASDEDAARTSLATEVEAKLAALNAQLAVQKAASEQEIKQKEGEIATLSKRLEGVQLQHSQDTLSRQQDEAAKIEEVEKAIESKLFAEYNGQLSDLENDLREATAQLAAVTESRNTTAAEFEQYKRRVAKAAAAPKQADEPAPRQAQLEEEVTQLKTDIAKATSALDQTARQLREALQAKEDVAEALAGAERRVMEAISTAEDAERSRYEAMQEVKDLKRRERTALQKAAAAARPPSTPPPASPSVGRTAAEKELERTQDTLRVVEAARDEMERKYRSTAAALKSVTEEMRRKVADSDLAVPQPHYTLSQKSSSVAGGGSTVASPLVPHPMAPQFDMAPQPPLTATRVLSDLAGSDDGRAGELGVANGDAAAAGNGGGNAVSLAPRRLDVERADSASVSASASAADLADSGFDLDDLVAVAEMKGKRSGGGEGGVASRLELTLMKLKKTTAQLHEARGELDRKRVLVDENARLKQRAADLERSVERQDSSRSLDYIKNTVMQFCLAKDNVDVQRSLIPLLASLLHLSPQEHASLNEHYPGVPSAGALGGWVGSVGNLASSVTSVLPYNPMNPA